MTEPGTSPSHAEFMASNFSDNWVVADPVPGEHGQPVTPNNHDVHQAAGANAHPAATGDILGASPEIGSEPVDERFEAGQDAFWGSLLSAGVPSLPDLYSRTDAKRIDLLEKANAARERALKEYDLRVGAVASADRIRSRLSTVTNALKRIRAEALMYLGDQDRGGKHMRTTITVAKFALMGSVAFMFLSSDAVHILPHDAADHAGSDGGNDPAGGHTDAAPPPTPEPTHEASPPTPEPTHEAGPPSTEPTPEPSTPAQPEPSQTVEDPGAGATDTETGAPGGTEVTDNTGDTDNSGDNTVNSGNVTVDDSTETNTGDQTTHVDLGDYDSKTGAGTIWYDVGEHAKALGYKDITKVQGELTHRVLHEIKMSEGQAEHISSYERPSDDFFRSELDKMGVEHVDAGTGQDVDTGADVDADQGADNDVDANADQSALEGGDHYEGDPANPGSTGVHPQETAGDHPTPTASAADSPAAATPNPDAGADAKADDPALAGGHPTQVPLPAESVDSGPLQNWGDVFAFTGKALLGVTVGTVAAKGALTLGERIRQNIDNTASRPPVGLEQALVNRSIADTVSSVFSPGDSLTAREIVQRMIDQGLLGETPSEDDIEGAEEAVAGALVDNGTLRVAYGPVRGALLRYSLATPKRSRTNS